MTPAHGPSRRTSTPEHANSPFGQAIERCSPGPAHRDRERERRPLSDHALQPDPAAMQLGKLATERQAEARTFHLLRGAADLTELLEHRGLILGGDPDACVRHRDLDYVV